MSSIEPVSRLIVLCACAPDPQPLLSTIEIVGGIVYPTPLLNISTENIDPVLSTIGIALAPIPSPKILTIGGIQVEYFDPTGNGTISFWFVGF